MEEIKDKKGEVLAKIAINPEEAFWQETKDTAIEAKATCDRGIKINDLLLELADKELKIILK